MSSWRTSVSEVDRVINLIAYDLMVLSVLVARRPRLLAGALELR